MADNFFKLNIYFGLSIILKYYYIFEQLINNNIFDKIFVSIDYNILKHFREDSNLDYFKNYIKFIKHINQYDRIVIEDHYNNLYKSIDLVSLSNMFNIPVKFKIYTSLINNQPVCSFDYVTISTKLLNIKYELYQQHKNRLFSELNNIGYKVLLLGERTITNCNEYKIHNVYSIYDDLIKNLNNYQDFTIHNNNNNNELEPFLKSATILNKSKLNIYMTNGGISEILGYVSTNILGLTDDKLNLLDKNNYINYDNSNIKVFNNFEDFLENLKIA